MSPSRSIFLQVMHHHVQGECFCIVSGVGNLESWTLLLIHDRVSPHDAPGQRVVSTLIAPITKLRNDSLQFAEGYMCCVVLCCVVLCCTVLHCAALYVENESWSRYPAFNVIFAEERGEGETGSIFSCSNCSACYYLQELAGTFSPAMSL